ncbi:MAG: UDP-N-acetylglucosamine 2-epimerase (non-hydrolyzing) [Bryobacteraceae bacterium]
MKSVLFVFGTRPEAIKLCPLILHIRRNVPALRAIVCVTGQHRDLLDDVLRWFGVSADYDLNLMQAGQSLSQLTAGIVGGLEDVFTACQPAMTVVQGDTATTLCGALASFYARVPVAHVEAGLRTGDLTQPFPEELNRILTTRLATLHFAATPWAAANLRAEGIPADTIAITGNTGIDALFYARERLEQPGITLPSVPLLNPVLRLILVTAHRRESFGPPMDRICLAVRELALRKDVQVVFPVHPNPNVREAVGRHLSGLENVLLTNPLSYPAFVFLLKSATVILTDSGGVQEEAPSLGKPVLLLRLKTERPEAVEAGTVRMVGSDQHRIVRETKLLLDDPVEYSRLARAHNPYGDGRASERIADVLNRFLS